MVIIQTKDELLLTELRAVFSKLQNIQRFYNGTNKYRMYRTDFTIRASELSCNMPVPYVTM